jgi:2-polyprenyl-6-methoxyphenol hydroxylase-like FAD-dependent oxidoreductase
MGERRVMENWNLLVGADRIHSRIRKYVDTVGPEMTYSGLLAIGGFAPLSKTPSANRRERQSLGTPAHDLWNWIQRRTHGVPVKPQR